MHASRYSQAYGGREMTVDEITGMLIAALFAGQHTSSITSTWTALYLFSDKYRHKFLPQILKEQKQIIAEHGEELNYEILSKMDFLHRGMKEALRLHPPLIMLMRYVYICTHTHSRSLALSLSSLSLGLGGSVTRESAGEATEGEKKKIEKKHRNN